MRAAVLTAPCTFELRDLPEPSPPAGGLILQVTYCGVCGSDIRRWREGPPASPGLVIPGHEVGGVVTAVGQGAVAFAVGDRLAVAPDVHCGTCYYCCRGWYNLCDDLKMVGITPGWPGGLADALVLNHDTLVNGIVHAIPEGVSFLDGALAEPLSSVVGLHQQLGTGPADTVVVIGAGPIGCLHVAIARARGATVIVSQRSAARRELVARFAPDAVIDPTTEDIVARVRELTGGRGADTAICANPVASTQAEAVRMVRKRGRVVLFGGLPKVDPMTHLDGNRIHYGEIEVLGSFSYHPTMHALALDVLRRGLVRGEDLVTHVYPLAEVDRAFDTASRGDGLKVMVRPGDGS